MAVQAQYPSNVLLLNRNGQEGNEFPLQQQAGGVFLDQSHSHMLFNNNNNPRKRGREVAGAAITAPINSYSMQTQPPQLIELSQLHHPNAQAEDAESAYVDPGRVVSAASGPCCKACRTRAAAVVLLPCRHLCLCTECDRVAQACPLCLTFRNSSVEVFLS
ncbi:hypothetical protein GOBAR_AA32752 [Gossypium barbadense]|uniref:RING-type domain-containing protein n=1 Tax=Gossypium barbadense TaxID=3634 RepID=A0A2P5WA24_GOSBA|nr:hypothetical protein GOBAR_AA32752 [Gossypium barbadense]